MFIDVSGALPVRSERPGYLTAKQPIYRQVVALPVSTTFKWKVKYRTRENGYFGSFYKNANEKNVNRWRPNASVLINNGLPNVADKFGVDSVYLDFAKAFDTVSHVKLLTKLTGYGIRGHLLGWITAFLSSRSQRIKIDHFLSSPSYVKSSVPQDSVLDPILFLIYMNDITDIFSGPTSIKLYADDAKLYSSIRCPDDSSLIQSGVNLVTEWSSTWQLS